MALAGLSAFNIDHGFVEALVRGFRTGFLDDQDYHHLSQCETLDDMKMNLAETDYGDALANEVTISPSMLERKAIIKMVVEFEYLQGQAVEPLSTFLNFITVEYMIQNVMLLLRGSMTGRNINELLANCHPLGMFKESTMRTIPNIDTSRGYGDLYETVLVDTPVGPYFQRFLDQAMAERRFVNSSMGTAGDMKNILEEVQIEILHQSLMKLYLEDFYWFCDSLGGDTATYMCDLLNARADRMAINLTLNSFGTQLNDPSMRDRERKDLYPSIGYLYPAGTDLLSKVDDEAKLGDAIRSFPEYSKIFDRYLNAGAEEVVIDDDFFKHEVKLCELAFESQMHFGCFYAFTRLKEQEIRNLVWISECILQRRKDRIGDYIPVFSKSSEWRCESTRKTA